MRRGTKSAGRKRRTRTHVIAELSENYFERFALLNNFSVENFNSDYGYDLNIYTHKANGEIENGVIFVQLKATDRIKSYKNSKAIGFQISKKTTRFGMRKLIP